MDKSDMILTQLPIVFSLILLIYQAYKTFEIKEFKFVFFGFIVNLFYLFASFLFALFKLTDDSLLGSSQLRIVLFYTTIIDVFNMLFFSMASINYLGNRFTKRHVKVLFFLLILISAFIRLIPDNPLNDFIPYVHVRYIPYSFMAFASIAFLANMFYKKTQKNSGSKLMIFGTLLWAFIQFIGILEFDQFHKIFHDDRMELIAFGLGFLSKTILLIGLFKYVLKIGIENSNKKQIASKLDLIFGVSFHEFTHPLMGIKSILQEVNPDDESKVSSHIGFYRKSVDRIDEHYNHLIAIINASIKMYVTDTGNPIVNEFYDNDNFTDKVVIESINTNIQVVVLSLKATTSRKDAEKINFEFNLGGNCIAKYNPNQMFQVFNNLFKNSKEAFRNQKGTVFIKTRVSPIKSEEGKIIQDRDVVIEIQDTGPGIDISIANNIFDSGFSSKSSIGRGLGLAIAKRLVEANSGRIELKIPEGNVGERIPAHFIITLPKALTTN